MGNQAARESVRRNASRQQPNSPSPAPNEGNVVQEQDIAVNQPFDEHSPRVIDIPVRPDTPRRMRPSLSAQQLASYHERAEALSRARAEREEVWSGPQSNLQSDRRAGAVHIEYVQDGSEMATSVEEPSREGPGARYQHEQVELAFRDSDESQPFRAPRPRRPSLMISDEDLTAPSSATHTPATAEPGGLERFRVSSADTRRLDSARSSFIETHAEMSRQGAGGNARASLERLLLRSDNEMRDCLAHKSQSRPATPRIPTKQRSRHARIASEHNIPRISLGSSSSPDEEEDWEQNARSRRNARPRSPLVVEDAESDIQGDMSNRRSGRQKDGRGIRFGGEPMQRSRSVVSERGRAQMSGDPLRLGEEDRWRSDSRARFEPRPGTWSEYAQSSRSRDKGKSKSFQDERRSSIRGEAIPAQEKSIQTLMHERAMQELNAPSPYEQLPAQIREQVHPMELEHDLRPWPWNTQPDNLPAGVASSSAIEGLNNIGWYCPGAERFARDLDDGTVESGEAVEEARKRWVQGLMLDDLKYEQRQMERRRKAQADAVERHRRRHSEAVTQAERSAQAEYLQDVLDDDLYETLHTRSGKPVRFPRESERFEDEQDDPDPLTNSVPIHFQLLDGQVEGARLLVRTRTVRQRPPTQSRNRSQGPPADSPRPRPRRSLHFSLDGACDSEEDFLSEGLGIVVDLDLDDSPRQGHSYLGGDGMSPSLSSSSQASIYSSPGVPSQGMVRQSPNSQNSMQQSQMQQQQQQQQNAQHQANGIHGGANSAAALQASLGHMGHQPDYNYLWGIVQELTEALAQNRAQTASIVRGVQQIQARARQEGEEMPSAQQVNGELAHAAEVADLENRLHEMARDRDDIAAQHAESVHILADYERTMDSLMVKIREYANNHAKAIIGVHQHYETQLAAEREANLQLRIEHGQWQAGLGRAADLARKALRNRSDEMTGLEADLREVKTENRILRRMVGWEVDDSSDDDEGPESSMGGSRFHDDAALRAVPSM